MGNFLKIMVWPKQYHILFNWLLFAKCCADKAVSETSVMHNNMEVVVGCKESSLFWGKIYSCEDETNVSSVRFHPP